ncbi:hypothetical protein LINGRAHAP2_LOCUS10368 [Linum grandiflorum]
MQGHDVGDIFQLPKTLMKTSSSKLEQRTINAVYCKTEALVLQYMMCINNTVVYYKTSTLVLQYTSCIVPRQVFETFPYRAWTRLPI